ncbi:MAG: hypothetical protein IKK09_04200 [Clostridia bacterium]|nr:hypothetical protein [Clostridia bacterium]
MKKKIICLVLSAAVVGGFAVSAKAKQDFVLNGLESEYYIMLNSDYANADDEAFLLGSLSAKYESNGDPASISEGKDTGGVSYGAYQFSSRNGVPMEFARWCISSGEGARTGQRLIDAFTLDNNTYGENFNAVWKAVAKEDAQSFLVLQHNYTKACYYDVMVSKLEEQIKGFDIDDYTIALKNVIWSRAVHHGVNSKALFNAFENIGGFNRQSEDVLIRAIYAESSKLSNTPQYDSSIAIERSSALKYGIDPETVTGKYLYHFERNSSDIQVSVYRRLAVRELADALAMYEKYKPETESTTKPVVPEETTTGGLKPVETTTASVITTTLPAEIEIPGETTTVKETTTAAEETTTRAPETTTVPEETTASAPVEPEKPKKNFFDYIVSFFLAIIRFFEAIFAAI